MRTAAAASPSASSQPGEEVEVDRFVAVYTERERPLPAVDAEREAREAAALGWDAVLAEHGDAWRVAWDRSDVEVTGAGSGVQVGIRFAIAQLIAVAPTADGRCSIAAKGLTGAGYKGHVFWDTDVFLMPFYAAALPEVARRLLEYRLHTLPAAERHAEDAGLAGAWFAWESAASGEDVTPAFVVGPGGRRLEVLTGQREIHVVADIAWSVDTYVRWSGDDRFLDEGGAELVLQAARFFATRAEETPRGFEIRHVIGPDELHEDVSNSAFTNTMAAWTLRRAAQLADGRRARSKLGEPARWRDIADRLVVLHTPDGLLEQHEGFLSLPLPPEERAGRDELAWQRDRQEWRDVKQADVVMLMALLEPQFTPEERLGNYHLYEPLTRHLSSLSDAVHSLVARRLGLHREADGYLQRAAPDRPRRLARQPRRGAAHGNPGRHLAGGRARMRRSARRRGRARARPAPAAGLAAAVAADLLPRHPADRQHDAGRDRDRGAYRHGGRPGRRPRGRGRGRRPAAPGPHRRRLAHRRLDLQFVF